MPTHSTHRPGSRTAFTPAPARLGDTVARAVEGIGVATETGVLVYADDVHARQFGYAAGQELLGRSWRTLFPPRVVATADAIVVPVLRERGRWEGEVETHEADGRAQTLCVVLERLPNGYVLCRSTSKAERDDLQARLQGGEHLFREVLRQVPLPLAIKDTQLRCTFINDAGLELLGLPRAQVAGRTLHEVLPAHAAQMEATDREVLAHGQPLRYEVTFETPGGPRYFRALKFRIDAPDAQPEHGHVATMWLDLTAERVNAQQKQAALEKQQHYLLKQREFISMVSHEFRTPLATMQGALHLLQTRLAKEADPKPQRWLNLMRDAMGTLRELADQVLELNRMDAPASATESPPLVLAHFLTAYTQSLADVHGPARIECEIAPEAPLTARVSASLLRTILDHFVANALKFSPPTSPVRVRVAPADGRVRIAVVDFGRGVPAGELTRLWNPFFRASNTVGVAGTGLGLTLVKRAAELINAEVGCVSTPEKGTEFWVEFAA